MPLQPAFGRFIEARWRAIGLHQAEFCRQIGKKPAGWIQQIRQGTKTPPMKEMETWATALKLLGYERQYFLDLAAIAHLPEEVQTRFEHMAEHARRVRMAEAPQPRSGTEK